MNMDTLSSGIRAVFPMATPLPPLAYHAMRTTGVDYPYRLVEISIPPPSAFHPPPLPSTTFSKFQIWAQICELKDGKGGKIRKPHFWRNTKTVTPYDRSSSTTATVSWNSKLETMTNAKKTTGASSDLPNTSSGSQPLLTPASPTAEELGDLRAEVSALTSTVISYHEDMMLLSTQLLAQLKTLAEKSPETQPVQNTISSTVGHLLQPPPYFYYNILETHGRCANPPKRQLHPRMSTTWKKRKIKPLKIPEKLGQTIAATITRNGDGEASEEVELLWDELFSVQCGLLENALKVFDENPERDKVTRTTVNQCGVIVDVVGLFYETGSSGAKPNEVPCGLVSDKITAVSTRVIIVNDNVATHLKGASNKHEEDEKSFPVNSRLLSSMGRMAAQFGDVVVEFKTIEHEDAEKISETGGVCLPGFNSFPYSKYSSISNLSNKVNAFEVSLFQSELNVDEKIEEVKGNSGELVMQTDIDLVFEQRVDMKLVIWSFIVGDLLQNGMYGEIFCLLLWSLVVQERCKTLSIKTLVLGDIYVSDTKVHQTVEYDDKKLTEEEKITKNSITVVGMVDHIVLYAVGHLRNYMRLHKGVKEHGLLKIHSSVSFAQDEGHKIEGAAHSRTETIGVARAGKNAKSFLPWTSDVHAYQATVFSAIHEKGKATEITCSSASFSWGDEETKSFWKRKHALSIVVNDCVRGLGTTVVELSVHMLAKYLRFSVELQGIKRVRPSGSSVVDPYAFLSLRLAKETSNMALNMEEEPEETDTEEFSPVVETLLSQDVISNQLVQDLEHTGGGIILLSVLITFNIWKDISYSLGTWFLSYASCIH